MTPNDPLPADPLPDNAPLPAGSLPQAPPAEPTTDPGGLTLVGLALLWIISASFICHLFASITDQFALSQGSEWPAGVWSLISVGHSVALLLPLTVLVLIVRGRRYRPVLQSWLLAAVFIFMLAFSRFPNRTASQTANLLQIILTTLFIAALLTWLRLQNPKSKIPRFPLFIP